MKTLEIRLSPHSMKHLFIRGFLLLLIIISIYFLYIKGKTSSYQSLILCLPILGFGWMFYISYKRIKANLPVLVFTELSIELSDNKGPAIIRWGNIQEWGIRQAKYSTYLWINSAGENHECSIQNLEKKIKEIEVLMEKYITYYAAK